jgi:hypothetical protein
MLYISTYGAVGVPVGEVDDQVHDDVGQQLLVDQLVHGAAPSQQNLRSSSCRLLFLQMQTWSCVHLIMHVLLCVMDWRWNKLVSHKGRGRNRSEYVTCTGNNKSTPMTWTGKDGKRVYDMDC